MNDPGGNLYARMSELTVPERRSFPRTSLSLPVQLTVVSASGAETGAEICLEGVTRDVSRGGCAVVADGEIGERARCVARFNADLGQLEPDTVYAEVRRTSVEDEGVLIGLEFETPLDTLRIAPRSESSESSNASAEPHSILVVDDQAGIRGLLARYLAERGFDVETAVDGEEAFQLISKSRPDVLLVDLYLPRLNGHDLLRRLAELDISIGLIYTMSGYADTGDAQECLRMGAADHLVKPIDLDHLHRNILLRLGALQV